MPRGSGLIAPLGALIGGAASGMIVGISAGSIGLRIGACVGGFVGLLGYLTLRSRRPGAHPKATHADPSPAFAPGLRSAVSPALRKRHRHPVLHFLLRLAGFFSGLLGMAAAMVTCLLMNDDRASETTILWACTFSVGLLTMAAAILWPSSGPPSRAAQGFRPELRRR